MADTVATLDNQTKQKIVDHIAVSNQLLLKGREKIASLSQEIAKRDAQASKAKSIIPNVVEALVANGHITKAQVKQASEVLADPNKALQYMQSLANATKRVEAPKRLGEPMTKSASTVLAGGEKPRSEAYRKFGQQCRELAGR